MATFGTPTHNATASLGNGQTLKWREFEYLSGSTTVVGYENDPTVKASFNFDNKYDKSYFNHNVITSNVDIVRRGYYFDGSGDYISLPNSNDFDLSSEDFTFETWVYPTDSTDGAIFHFGNTYGSNQGLALTYWKSGSEDPRFRLYVNDSQITACTSDQFAPNNWYHVALVKDNGNFRIYVNGVAQGSATSATHTHNSTNLNIGYYNNIYYFSGYMSDILISKGVARYTASFDETVNPEYDLDSSHVLALTGSATDASDSAHSITFNGDAHPTTKFTEASFLFDTNHNYVQLEPYTPDFNRWTLNTSQHRTYEAWFLPKRDDASNGTIFSGYWYQSGYADKGWILTTYSTGGNANKIRFLNISGGTYATDVYTTGTASADQWHHVALVTSGSNVKVFLNGNQEINTTFSNSDSDNNLRLNLGSTYTTYGTTNYLDGYISEFRVSEYARYTASFDVPTSKFEVDDARVSYLVTPDHHFKNFQIDRSNDSPSFEGNAKAIRAGYVFDGTNDYIAVSGGTSTFAPGNGDFTIEFSLNADSTSGSPALLSSLGNYQSGFSGGWAVSLDSNSKINIWTDLGGNTSKVKYFNDLTISANKWYNLAIVRTNTNTFKLYKDGVLVSTAGDWNQTNGTTQFNYPLKSIGRYQPDNSSNLTSYFDGYITDIRLTEEALYTSDYTSTFPLTKGTNTKFLLTGSSNVDTSDCGHTITLNGALPTSIFGSGSFYLDGTGDYITIPPPHSNFKWSPSDNDWTWEIYALRQDATGGIMGTMASSTDANGWDFYFGGSNNLSAYYYDSYVIQDSDIPAGGTRATTTNEWYHLAATYQSSSQTLRFFRNGTMFIERTGISNLPESTGKTMRIGEAKSGGTDYVTQGYFDQFRVTIGEAKYTASFDTGSIDLVNYTEDTSRVITETTYTLTSSFVLEKHDSNLTFHNSDFEEGGDVLFLVCPAEGDTEIKETTKRRMSTDSSVNWFDRMHMGNAVISTSIPPVSGCAPMILSSRTDHNDHLKMPQTYIDDIGNVTSQNGTSWHFTYEIWAYIPSGISSTQYITWSGGQQYGPYYGFVVKNSTQVCFRVVNGSGDGGQATDVTGTYVADDWNHLKFIISGGSSGFYINGQKIGSFSYWDVVLRNFNPRRNPSGLQNQAQNLAYKPEIVRSTTIATAGARVVNYVDKGSVSIPDSFTPPSYADLNSAPKLKEVNRIKMSTLAMRPRPEPPTPPAGQYAIYEDTPDDENTVLLIHFDGTQNSTTFRDVSRKLDGPPHTVNVVGNGKMVTGSAKFGDTSYYGDGSGDYLSIPASNDFLFDGDFTIEGFYKFSQDANYRNKELFNMSSGGTNTFSVFSSTGQNKKISVFANSSYLIQHTAGGVDNWSNDYEHIALVRSGSSLMLFVTGSLVETTTTSATLGSTSLNFGIGGGPAGYSWSGWIDEFRISKVARYTASFDPPKLPFGGGLRMKDSDGRIYAVSLSGSV